MKKDLTVYSGAVALFNQPNPTPYSDSLALQKFLRTIQIIRPETKNALVLFDCYESAGIIKQTYGFQQQAIAFYKNAIACCLTYHCPDSLQFKPLSLQWNCLFLSEPVRLLALQSKESGRYFAEIPSQAGSTAAI